MGRSQGSPKSVQVYFLGLYTCPYSIKTLHVYIMIMHTVFSPTGLQVSREVIDAIMFDSLVSREN